MAGRVCFVTKCNGQIKSMENIIIEKGLLCDKTLKKIIQFLICQNGEEEKETSFTRDSIILIEQIESSNRETEIRLFLSCQEKKKFLLVLSATEI